MLRHVFPGVEDGRRPDGRPFLRQGHEPGFPALERAGIPRRQPEERTPLRERPCALFPRPSILRRGGHAVLRRPGQRHGRDLSLFPRGAGDRPALSGGVDPAGAGGGALAQPDELHRLGHGPEGRTGAAPVPRAQRAHVQVPHRRIRLVEQHRHGDGERSHQTPLPARRRSGAESFHQRGGIFPAGGLRRGGQSPSRLRLRGMSAFLGRPHLLGTGVEGEEIRRTAPRRSATSTASASLRRGRSDLARRGRRGVPHREAVRSCEGHSSFWPLPLSLSLSLVLLLLFLLLLLFELLADFLFFFPAIDLR